MAPESCLFHLLRVRCRIALPMYHCRYTSVCPFVCFMHAFKQELTVKGLEQEISKITCNHQKEITELKRQHQEEILNAVEEARQKHESLEMSIRETYARDREVAIEKERNAIRER